MVIDSEERVWQQRTERRTAEDVDGEYQVDLVVEGALDVTPSLAPPDLRNNITTLPRRVGQSVNTKQKPPG